MFRLFLLLIVSFKFQTYSVYASEELFSHTIETEKNLSNRPNPIPCMQGDKCPWSEGVGVFGYTKFKCVATYITYNKKPAILTAEHCLKNENVGDEIDGFFLLPTVIKNNKTYRSEEISLLRVERRFNEKDSGLDIAIVSLKESPYFHKPRSISKKEFVYGEKYSFIGQNYDFSIKNNYWSLQENCSIDENNLFAVKSFRPTMHALGNCSVGDGNSGAPVFDESGDIVAVINSYIKPEDLLLFYHYALKNNFMTKSIQPSLKPSYTYISWLGCLKNNFYTVDTECTAEKRYNFIEKEELIEEDGTLFTAVSNIPLYNELDVFVPNCIKNSDIGVFEKNGIYQRYTVLTVYHPELDYNLNFREPRKKLKSHGFALLDELKDKNSYLLTFHAVGTPEMLRVLFKTEVPVCK